MHQPSGFRRVVRDIADLCELQVELIAVDGKVAANRSGMAAAMLIVASVFALSAVVAVVLALASLLHEQLGWTVSSSLLASAVVALVVGGLFAIVGSLVLKNAMSALDETRSEFAENLRWIKAAVVSPETSPRAQVNEQSFTSRRSASFERGHSVNGNSGDSRN